MRKFINESLGLPDSGTPLGQDMFTENDEKLKQIAKANGGFMSVKDIENVYGSFRIK